MTRPPVPLNLPLRLETRRALVVLEFVCTVVAVVLGVLGIVWINTWFLVLGALPAMLAAAVAHTRLAMSIQNIAQVSVRTLDERQRDARDRAFSRSLGIVGATLGALFAYALLALFFDLWTPGPSSLWLVLWLPMQLCFGLPTAIIAWTEPDTMPDLE
jgi:apolipoprotein N-acyltransferase